MIVVVTNVLVYLTVQGEFTARCVKLLNDENWHLPSFWRSEYMNVLATRMRYNNLSLSDAQNMLDYCVELVGDNEHWTDAAIDLELAHASGCSAYDCEFVATAMALNVPLITFDKKVLTAFPAIARTP